ncbi:MAG: 4Fe-4S binding protein [Archaeoglobus sp.]|nr:4Fe-4S binding protein [Archaeoglobus sp.]
MARKAVVNRGKCAYCGACVAVCDFFALELVEMYLEINENCNGCSICVKVCPMGALSLVEV